MGTVSQVSDVANVQTFYSGRLIYIYLNIISFFDIGLVVLGKKMKMQKVYRWTDDEQQAVRIAHLSLQFLISWAIEQGGSVFWHLVTCNCLLEAKEIETTCNYNLINHSCMVSSMNKGLGSLISFVKVKWVSHVHSWLPKLTCMCIVFR